MVETEFCSSQVGNWNGSISMFIILLSTIITLVIAQTIPDYSISEYEPTGQLPPGCSSAMLGLSLDGYTMVSFGCNNSNWQFNVLTNSWMKVSFLRVAWCIENNQNPVCNFLSFKLLSTNLDVELKRI
eukprot:TRINITY_DN2529_c0_g1_i3.p2 TRINITY_DN2529_c0_g1~~TRINITY_DN2529_c0_g1_i3.p2  ORF type:complete len:128 (+),score=0.28 TRINITY_DN2529_c0_g1_i3:37-420(+)